MYKLFPFMIYLLLLEISQLPGVISLATFTFLNKCDQTVWPGISSNGRIESLQPTGFTLLKGESKELTAPLSWGGRFWGRTRCSEDSVGRFTCETGDCGSGKMECAGAGVSPPATLAEFTINGEGGMDFYDVSLVDGFNLPMLVSPIGGSGPNCTSTGCIVDLNGKCPSELKVMNNNSGGGEAMACKSACVAFGGEEYCCRGAYGSRDTCKPSSYSQMFKTACPRVSSYAFDEKTIFTCTGANYHVIFCPTSTTSKKSKDMPQTPTAQKFNTSMVYEGLDASGNSSAPPLSTNIRAVIVVVVVVALIILGAGAAYAVRIGNVNILNGSCNRFYGTQHPGKS